MASDVSLLGRYRTPRFKYGAAVFDSVRGDVVIVGLTDAPIPWPIGKRGRAKTLVVFGDLERAIRTESNLAVCHWWGVTAQTVTKWRKVLGVPMMTPGSSKLRRDLLAPRGDAMRAKIDPRDPERRAKIAASKLGKPRPKAVMAKLRRANLGRPLSAEHRRKISERNRATGNRPPTGRLWTPEEDETVRTLSVAAAAEKLSRSPRSIYMRRQRLGVADGRRR